MLTEFSNSPAGSSSSSAAAAARPSRGASSSPSSTAAAVATLLTKYQGLMDAATSIGGTPARETEASFAALQSALRGRQEAAINVSRLERVVRRGRRTSQKQARTPSKKELAAVEEHKKVLKSARQALREAEEMEMAEIARHRLYSGTRNATTSQLRVVGLHGQKASPSNCIYGASPSGWSNGFTWNCLLEHFGQWLQ